MKIATWNLGRPLPRHTNRCREIHAWMDRIAADMWILTETHDTICPGPGYRSVSTAVTDRPQKPGERWTTIWSRFPITSAGPTRDGTRAVAGRIELPEGQELIVYGTVLPWLGSSWRGYTAAGGAAFRAALDAQHADWLDLQCAHPSAGLIVAGDLNQDLSDTHYYGSAKNRRALRDTLASAGLSTVTAGADDPVRRIAPTHASIDHISLSRSLLNGRSTHLEVWPAATQPDPRLSDHFGVVIKLGVQL